jgi:hypothetical protein
MKEALNRMAVNQQLDTWNKRIPEAIINRGSIRLTLFSGTWNAVGDSPSDRTGTVERIPGPEGTQGAIFWEEGWKKDLFVSLLKKQIQQFKGQVNFGEKHLGSRLLPNAVEAAGRVDGVHKKVLRWRCRDITGDAVERHGD